MARKTQAQVQFDALAIEGALLPAEWLAKVAALEAPAQAPADYAIPRGLQLRDEIGRYWRIAEAIWADFAAARGGGDPVGAANRLAHDLLIQVLGFSDVTAPGERSVSGRAFHLAFEARGGHVPVVVGPPTEGMDQSVARHGDGIRRRSAWGALQEYLNASERALWGIATNGLVLRLGRDNASFTRPAWLEADLERIFTEQRFADFAVLWLSIHGSRFGRADQAVQEAPLERWREAGREEGTRAREALRIGVEQALLMLGQGFLSHSTNTELREALAAGTLTPAEYFNELLRLVYRMIFLLTVEERGILHAPASTGESLGLYADGYSMRRLRERSLRHAAHDRHVDLWASLRPVFSALGGGNGEAALGLPGLGGLFAADQCPHIDAATIANRALLIAVFRLAWLREGGALAKVNWKDMGVEEFGSVYESLLELVPVVSDGGRRFAFAGVSEAAGNARKLTGSYYTPDALVQELLDGALEPVVAQRLAQNPGPEDAERALLSIAVVDPACGSGHFLLAAARRLAGHLARLRVGGTPGGAEYRRALRDVVTHCIHGVDRNPMALELARMALWLEAYTPDRALGFLDHHLVTGDALLGLLDLRVLKDGIPDEAFRVLTGDDKDISKALIKLNRAGRRALEEGQRSGQFALDLGVQALADGFARLDQLSDDAVGTVDAKRQRYDALRAEVQQSRAAVAADMFVAAFLAPKRLARGERALTDRQVAERFATTTTIGMVLDGTMTPEHRVAVAARSVCRDAGVLHWPLAFPQVFARGGFDVVLGNPPWERIKLQEQEFFAVRAPQVAQARNKAERVREIARMESAEEGTPERGIFEDFLRAKQLADASSVFCHSDARYPLSGVGDVNTYALFAESMYRMISDKGRAGAVLPLGIVTDDSTKAFFDDVVSNERLVAVNAFENEEQLFEAVHHAFRFCLFVLAGSRQPAPARMVFFARRVEQLREKERAFTLSTDDFRLINPNTRTCPVFRSAEDARLARVIHARVPVLINEGSAEGNAWSVSFMAMYHMSNDSTLFRTEPDTSCVPLYEAKMIHQFDHRWATYDNPQGLSTGPEARSVTDGEKAIPGFSAIPRYWVSTADVNDRLSARGWTRGWLFGFRGITGVEKIRTVIVSVIPRSAVGNSLPTVLFESTDEPKKWAALLGNMNALVFDFVARHKIGGANLNYFVFKQLPTLRPERYRSADLEFIVPRVLELTYTASDLAAWAQDLEFDGPPFVWDRERRSVLRAELDAWYARAYGVTRDELRFVLDPAEVMGPDYPSETFRVLKQNEEREFGEYRTRRLVLQAYDALVAGTPMPSEVAPSSGDSNIRTENFRIRPQLEVAAARALAVVALVRAAGGTLEIPEMVRALVLRASPAELVRHSPTALADATAAWARSAVADPLENGSVLALVEQLVDRQALRWKAVSAGPRVVTVTDHTPASDVLDPWFRAEAQLLLSVLHTMPAVELQVLDAGVSADDRARLYGRSA